ncbi:MAG TPA: acetyl-CoA hydrolase/transferase C-terminal domain-containing protein, partial [Dehalococcoidia bacterium]|nr:acetyl-CoA hydrolase/transferase C-terminal domain-containing protein [Dehalococcoidia bacterium]
TVSRIVPQFDRGQVVSVPRTFVDYVVTEHGIASLQGRSQRARAEALIEIADPAFRDELRAEARRLFWPD